MPTPRRVVPYLAIGLLSAATASAQVGLVFNRTGSGARAAGMANAFIAISDDGTAASWNPAGLGQLRKPEISIVSSTVGRTLSAAGFRTRDGLSTFTPMESSYQSTHLDFASLAVPVTLWGRPVTFQASWRNLYCLDYREVVSTTREGLTPESPPPARIDINSDLVGSVNLVTFSAAVKVTSRLALGGGWNIWQGDWTQDDAINEVALSGTEAPRSLFVSQTNRVRGDSFNFGAMLTYTRWSVGFLYQGPLSSDFRGDARATLSGEPPRDPPAVEARLRFPQSFGAGAAYRPGASWTLALDFTWDEWTDTTITSAEEGTINIFDGLPPDRSSTRNTLSLNGGAEKLFTGEGFVVPLRFGAAWEPQGGRSPYTRDPVNFVLLAAGTGYNTNSLKFDAAFQYRWTSFLDGAAFGLADSTIVLPSAVGERSIKDWRLKFSVILRVTDTDKLRRTFHKVFGGGES
jgi:long-subunit fatty acid transport protein